jgi:hypothetical protein
LWSSQPSISSFEPFFVQWSWCIFTLHHSFTFKFGWRIWQVIWELRNSSMNGTLFSWIRWLECFIVQWSLVSLFSLFWRFLFFSVFLLRHHWVFLVLLSQRIEWFSSGHLRKWFFLDQRMMNFQLFLRQNPFGIVSICDVRNRSTERSHFANSSHLGWHDLHIWRSCLHISLFVLVILFLVASTLRHVRIRRPDSSEIGIEGL